MTQTIYPSTHVQSLTLIPGGVLHSHARDLNRLLRLWDPLLLILLLQAVQVMCGPLPGTYAQLLLLLIPLLSWISLGMSGIYASFRQLPLWSLLQRVSFGFMGVVSGLLLLGYATKTSAIISREVLGLWSALAWLGLVGEHLLVRKWLRWQRRLGRNSRTAIFWGNASQASRFFETCRTTAHQGIQPLVWFGPERPEQLGAIAAQYSGNLDALRDYLRCTPPDLIYVSDTTADLMPQVLQVLGDGTRPVLYLPSWSHPSMSFSPYFLGSQPSLALWVNPLSPLDHQIKRAGDWLVAAIALLLLSPLLLSTALAVRLTSPGPILFCQRRYGLDGKEFRVFKFRTMTVLEDGEQVTQAQRQDKRLTPIGGFLRRWSLDELPQLLNVLEGSMSLVGPRPHAVAHNELYRRQVSGYMLRHMLKPGITGLAQVEGHRGETRELEQMAARIEADLRYVRHWSLGLDLKILCLTLLRLSSSQAY